MRIGLFTDVYEPYIGGVCTSVVMLKRALELEGHVVYIVTVYPDKLKFEYKNKILRLPGIPIGIYNYRVPLAYSVKASSIIKTWNLDIIHSHTEFSLGNFARVLSVKYKIPLVHTYHTLYEDYLYNNLKYSPGIIMKILRELTVFYCDKTVNALIVPTIKTAKLLKEKYNIKREIAIIPTGIDIMRFSKDDINLNRRKELLYDLGIEKDDFVLLYLGRIAKEKNIEYIIDCYKRVINKKIKLLIVGDGPELLHLKFICKNTKGIIFTGKIPWTDVPLYYSLCDIFVMPSTTETQGLTVIEALSAGKPVVCINDSSYENIVINNYNGLIFNNKNQCIQIINELFNDRILLNRLSINAKNSSIKYSLKEFSRKVLKVYKKVLLHRSEVKDNEKDCVS